ncbi:hypothetical protein GCM10027160_31070 [Streptomyces calidiresistens]|uniref:Uncharacterized protein n=1 Tax=Streptomyces calidiresistens TaxID=1485586 RepID=A0A7W3T8D3_9ACTN|nr:hypothetical protein [Streptomyces calidiresistens]MBB0232829.1 hypothetical protein [Streptomyces calidiresistens]
MSTEKEKSDSNPDTKAHLYVRAKPGTAGNGPSGALDAPWKPDAKTLHWCFGSADEREVAEGMKADIANRIVGQVEEGSDEYWEILAEIAIESTLHSLLHRAVEMGTEMGRESGEE